MAPSLMLNKMPMTPGRVMGAVVGVACLCLVFSALSTSKNPDILEPIPRGLPREQRMANEQGEAAAMAGKTDNFWGTYNFQTENIPAEVNIKAGEVKTIEKHVNIMGIDTFYVEALPPNGVESSGEVVLLLHGAAFTSKTWEKRELQTNFLLAAMGHRVIAVDLPGFGESPRAEVRNKEAQYLDALLKKLKVTVPVVLVSPSMSGRFSVPFLLTHTDKVAGYVPVAPVNTEALAARASELSVPTLIVYGQKDTGLGLTSKTNLEKIPLSQAVELPNAPHPAYLDQPLMFNTLLYNFIKQIHLHKKA